MPLLCLFLPQRCRTHSTPLCLGYDQTINGNANANTNTNPNPNPNANSNANADPYPNRKTDPKLSPSLQAPSNLSWCLGQGLIRVNPSGPNTSTPIFRPDNSKPVRA